MAERKGKYQSGGRQESTERKTEGRKGILLIVNETFHVANKNRCTAIPLIKEGPYK